MRPDAHSQYKAADGVDSTFKVDLFRHGMLTDYTSADIRENLANAHPRSIDKFAWWEDGPKGNPFSLSEMTKKEA